MIVSSVIRLLKVVALLGFLLPWFAVSCSDKRLIEPRGYEIALGFEVQAHEDFTTQAAARPAVIPASAAASDVRQTQPRGWRPPPVVQATAAGAALLLAISLAVGFFLRAQAFAAASALAGFAAAGLAYATVAAIDFELRRQLAEGTQGADNPFAGLAGSLLKVSFEPGVWMTVLGAGLAGLLATFLILMNVQAAQASRPNAPPG